MTGDSLRLDKWLWYARFFKSRSKATRFCVSSRLRVNSTVIDKAHYRVRPGDVLTFPKGPHIRVVRIRMLGVRRGPVAEARTLYDDLEPPTPPGENTAAPPPAPRERGAGRPTKAERRAIERLKGAE